MHCEYRLTNFLIYISRFSLTSIILSFSYRNAWHHPKSQFSCPRMALVHAAISTSAPILDLSSQKPLKIQIRLTLQNDNPITFQNSQSGLFDGRLLFQGGLTFIDVSDNTEVSRNHLHLCRLEGEAETLTESTADEFTTLFPGQPHEIETQFNFITVPSDGPQSWPGMTAEEWLDKKEAMPSNDVQKWPNTHGFQDGRTYEIQVSSEAAIKNWWEESKQDLMVSNFQIISSLPDST